MRRFAWIKNGRRRAPHSICKESSPGFMAEKIHKIKVNATHEDDVSESFEAVSAHHAAPTIDDDDTREPIDLDAPVGLADALADASFLSSRSRTPTMKAAR